MKEKKLLIWPNNKLCNTQYMTKQANSLKFKLMSLPDLEICHTLTDPSQLADACRNETIDFSIVRPIILYGNWFKQAFINCMKFYATFLTALNIFIKKCKKREKMITRKMSLGQRKDLKQGHHVLEMFSVGCNPSHPQF